MCENEVLTSMFSKDIVLQTDKSYAQETRNHVACGWSNVACFVVDSSGVTGGGGPPRVTPFRE